MKVKNIRLIITICLVLAMAIVFSVTADYFFSARNISQMLREAAYTGLLAVGMSFVMIGGGIDLSLGGIVCAVGVVTLRFSVSFPGLPGIVVMLIAILCGCLLGYINSLLVTKLHMTEFVATLASGIVYSGLGLVLAFREGAGIASVAIKTNNVLNYAKGISFSKSFTLFYFTIAWLVVLIAAMLVMRCTKLGRHTYACGSNAKSAQMSGISLRKTKTRGFLICGCIAGLAGFMITAQQGTANVGLGQAMEFQAIAACVVGGIAMSGGKGDPLAASLGALFMVMLSNGLKKFGLSTAWNYIYQGGIIIVATVFDAWFQAFIASRRQKKAGAAAAAKLDAGNPEMGGAA